MPEPPSFDEPPSDAETEQLPPAEIAPPQLRLHHFFELTAVAAVLLAIAGPQRNFGDAKFQAPEIMMKFFAVVGVAYQIVAAVAITALAYGFAAYRRGQLFFNQPGHWILVEISLFTLATIPSAIAFRSMSFESPMTPGDTQFMWLMIAGLYYWLFLGLGRMLVNVYLGITKCRQRRWKSVFFGKAAAAVIVGVGDIAVLLLLLSAMRIDRREQLLRNAGHRCGVYVQLAQSSIAILSMSFGVLNALLMFGQHGLIAP